MVTIVVNLFLLVLHLLDTDNSQVYMTPGVSCHSVLKLRHCHRDSVVYSFLEVCLGFSQVAQAVVAQLDPGTLLS